MAVNDADLAIKVTSLDVLIQELNSRLIQLSTVRDVLNGIKADHMGGPYDLELEQAMSDARRQEIYDRCMARADVLLAIWPSDPDAPPASAPDNPPPSPPPEDDT